MKHGFQKMPSFGNPSALLWSLLIAPLVILYLRNQGLRRHSVSAILFWESSPQIESTQPGKRRLQDRISLFLLSLAVLCGAVAAAQPSWNTQAFRLKSQTSRSESQARSSQPVPDFSETGSLILVIDDSVSLNVRDCDEQTRFEAAIHLARSIIESKPDALPMAIVTTSFELNVRCRLTKSQSHLLETLDGLHLTNGGGGPSSVWKSLSGAGQFGPETTQFIVLSDESPIEISSSDVVRQSDQDHVTWHQLGESQDNLAIVGLHWKHSEASPDSTAVPKLILDVDVRSFSRTSQQAELRVLFDQEIFDVIPLELNANEPRAVTVELPAAAEGHLTVSLLHVPTSSSQVDPLPIDNTVSISIAQGRPATAALVTSGNIFLQRALESSELISLQTFSPSEPEAVVEFQPELLILDEPTSETLARLNDLAVPALVIQAPPNNTNEPSEVNVNSEPIWVYDAPGASILKDLNSPELKISNAISFDLANSPIPLLQTADGQPLLVKTLHKGQSRLLMGFNPTEDELPIRSLFPALMEHLIQDQLLLRTNLATCELTDEFLLNADESNLQRSEPDGNSKVQWQPTEGRLPIIEALICVAILCLIMESILKRPRWSRAIIIMLLILALANLSFMMGSSDQRLIVLVDESLSIGEAGQQQVEQLLQSLQTDQGLVNLQKTQLRFAAHCRNAQSTTQGAGPSMAWEETTNIADALRTAILTSSAEEETAILLISDGHETVDDANAVARLSPVPISTLSVESGARPEIELKELIIPSTVPRGEPVQIQALIEATDDCEAVIRCSVDGIETSQATQRLLRGGNKVLLSQRFLSDAELTIELIPSLQTGQTTSPDTFAQNNLLTRKISTLAPLKVLVVDTTLTDLESFQKLLELEGIDCDLTLPGALPTTQAELNHYGVVLLSGVPATDLSAAQQESLRHWVEYSGGGILMTGGDRSFGPGGYYQTPVEQLLPVRCDFIEEEEKPSVGLVMIIDKSGSMSGPKMELARDAAKAAVELLSPSDYLGIIAFDGEPVWIRTPAPLTDRELTIGQIDRILPGGGTALFPALVEAQRAVPTIETRLRHILVLTDGYSTEGEFERIAQEISDGGVTISAAGLGDADRTLVELLARIGRGRHYFTQDPRSVPQIFARETMLAGSTSLREEPFVPTLIRRSASLFGIPFSECPPLHGYVRTRTKPNSEVLLMAPNGDPVLSWWRAGSGWGAAFTSDIHPRWSREWHEWNSGGRFWAQVLRHLQRTPQPEGQTGPVITGARRTLADSNPGSSWGNNPGIKKENRSEFKIARTDTELMKQLALNSGGVFAPDPGEIASIPRSKSIAGDQPLRRYVLPVSLLLVVMEVVYRRKQEKERSVHLPGGK